MVKRHPALGLSVLFVMAFGVTLWRLDPWKGSSQNEEHHTAAQNDRAAVPDAERATVLQPDPPVDTKEPARAAPATAGATPTNPVEPDWATLMAQRQD